MKGKTIAKGLLLAGMVGVLVLGGGYVGYREYVTLRQSRLLRQAHNFLDQSDSKNALLCLQRVLRYNANDLEATRLMADLMDGAHAPNAVKWRRRVVELNPHSLQDRLALVETAMNFDDVTTATNVMAQVAPADRQTARYQIVAGNVAATLNQVPEAERYFQEALRLEPGSLQARMNLAYVQLRDASPVVAAAARTALEGFSQNPTNATLRCQALRELIGDTVRKQQLPTALAFSALLLRETNAVFSDRVLNLQLLHDTGDAAFASTQLKLQQAAGASNNPYYIFLLAQWESGQTSPTDAMKWLQTLPPTIVTNQPLATLMADNYVTLRQWPALQAFLTPQSWAERDCLRHAYLARALREQNSDAGARVEWELAVRSTQSRDEQLVMLQQLVTRWRWKPELQEVLQNIVNQHPEDQTAVAELVYLLYDSGQTRGLLVLSNLLAKRDPADLNNQNTMIMTALLVDAMEYKPHELAQKLYQQVPTNVVFASTYAFSLHLQHQDAAALKVFQQLPPNALEQPAVAGYYGLVLQGLGEKQTALHYLNLASKAKLLPEEKKLFDQARLGR